MADKPTTDRENSTDTSDPNPRPFGKDQAVNYGPKELDTTVEDQNKEEVERQIAEADDETEDPGKLTEDLNGDYQRRVQYGVDPTQLSYDSDEDDPQAKTGYKPEGKTSMQPKG